MAKRNKSAKQSVKQVRVERRGRIYLVGLASNGRYVSWQKESPATEMPKLTPSVSDGVEQSA